MPPRKWCGNQGEDGSRQLGAGGRPQNLRCSPRGSVDNCEQHLDEVTEGGLAPLPGFGQECKWDGFSAFPSCSSNEHV